jgi:hypothetical protein
MKKILLILCILPMFAFSQNQTSTQTKVTLYEGTEVSAKCLTELKGSQLKNGDNINFELAKPIIINDKEVVRAGLHIIGTVINSSASGAFGKKGKLEFSIDYMYLPDGRPVKLRNTVAAQTKGRGVETALISVVISPLGLFIHGQQAKFEAGTTFKAFIDHDVELVQK